MNRLTKLHKKGKKKTIDDHQTISYDQTLNTIDDEPSTRRTSKKKKPAKSQTPSSKTPQTGSSRSHSSKDRLMSSRPRTNTQRKCLLSFLKRTFEIGPRGLLTEYTEQIRSYVPPTATFNAFTANANKNRYHDVMCLDATRVKLRGKVRDYIHASYVQGPPLKNQFICTQGPMRNTMPDFWAMVQQEDVGHILMLCETVENGIEKCYQYWPTEVDGELEVGKLTVKNIGEERRDGVVITTLKVQQQGKEPKTLKHYQWRSWPDKSVPQSYMAPFRMLRVARQSKKTTIVHCSAGIGRTGTLVCLELALQTAFGENELSMPSVVKQLREMRMHCIQTDLQYLYMHECIRTLCTKFKIITDEKLQQKNDEFEREYEQILDERLPKDRKKGYDEFRPAKGFQQPAAP